VIEDPVFEPVTKDLPNLILIRDTNAICTLMVIYYGYITASKAHTGVTSYQYADMKIITIFNRIAVAMN
jgi:hypothetical protein